MKTISIVTACYNEEDNVEELYNRVRQAMLTAGRYRYEHIFIDNASRDGTATILSELAAEDAFPRGPDLHGIGGRVQHNRHEGAARHRHLPGEGERGAKVR